MRLSDVFDERLIMIDLKSTTKGACFEELTGPILAVRPGLDREKVLAAINEREAKLETSVMTGVAVPHGYYEGFREIVGAIGFSRGGIDYGAVDHGPVHLVFLLLLGKEEREQHLQVLSRLVAFLQSGAPARIQGAKSPGEVYALIRAEEEGPREWAWEWSREERRVAAA